MSRRPIGIAQAARGRRHAGRDLVHARDRRPAADRRDARRRDRARSTTRPADAPAYYMINCAHPTHFERRAGSRRPWVDRIRGLRANASRRSHAELDASHRPRRRRSGRARRRHTARCGRAAARSPCSAAAAAPTTATSQRCAPRCSRKRPCRHSRGRPRDRCDRARAKAPADQRSPSARSIE